MKTCSAVTIIIFVLVTSLSQAATIRVPQDQATITSAVAAATNPGDIVLITDSATYEETSIILSVPITVKAEPGQNPTIKCPTNKTYVIYMPVADTKFGSSDGGKITIDSNGLAYAGIYVYHTSGKSTVQNVEIKNPMTVSGCVGGLYIGATGDVDVQDVLIDMSKTGTRGIVLGHFNAQETWAANSTYNLTNVKSINPGPGTLSAEDGFLIYYIRSNTTINLDNCQFFGSWRGIYILDMDGSAPVTLNLDRCLLVSNEESQSIGYGIMLQSVSSTGEKMVIDAKNSAFVTNYYAVYSQSNDGTEGMKSSIHVDHCDMVGTAVDAGILVYKYDGPTEGEGRTWSFTNNILSSKYYGFYSRNESENRISDYNNYNCPYINKWPAGTHDIVLPGVDPGYTSLANYNFTYSNTQLKTASSTGGPIGSCVNFAEAPPSPTPSVNQAQSWGFYN